MKRFAVRPPEQPLLRVKLLFLSVSFFFLVTLLPQVAFEQDRPVLLRLFAVISVLGLIGWWTRCYRADCFPVAGLPFEGIALFAVYITVPEAGSILPVIFLGLNFRSLFGGLVKVILYTVTCLTAGFAGELVRPTISGNPSGMMEYVQSIASAPVIALIAHLLAVSMDRAQRAAAREREISAASLALARAVTVTELRQTAIQSAAAILPSIRTGTINLYLGDEPAPVPDEPTDREARLLVLPVTARDGELGRLVVDPGRDRVPTESRAALQALTQALAQSLTTLRLYEDLRTRAERDSLTGLVNRSVLHTRLAAAVAAVESGAQPRPTGVYVLLIDLDGFKDVNDTFGHAAGDAVLRTVASRLRNVARQEDVVARLGGDEFAVVLPDAAAEDAAAITRRFTAALAEPVALPTTCVVIDASVGVSCWTPGMSGDDLLHAADLAMYQMKRSRPAASLTVQPLIPAEPV